MNADVRATRAARSPPGFSTVTSAASTSLDVVHPGRIPKSRYTPQSTGVDACRWTELTAAQSTAKSPAKRLRPTLLPTRARHTSAVGRAATLGVVAIEALGGMAGDRQYEDRTSRPFVSGEARRHDAASAREPGRPRLEPTLGYCSPGPLVTSAPGFVESRNGSPARTSEIPDTQLPRSAAATELVSEIRRRQDECTPRPNPVQRVAAVTAERVGRRATPAQFASGGRFASDPSLPPNIPDPAAWDSGRLGDTEQAGSRGRLRRVSKPRSSV